LENSNRGFLRISAASKKSNAYQIHTVKDSVLKTISAMKRTTIPYNEYVKSLSQPGSGESTRSDFLKYRIKKNAMNGSTDIKF
jgi:hypothetical protein